MNPVDNEILAALQSCLSGLGRKELFSLCDSAVSEHNVSDAIKRLKDNGLVKVVAEKNGKSGAVYALVDDTPVLSETELFLRAALVLPKFDDLVEEAGPVMDKIAQSVNYQLGNDMAASLAANGLSCDSIDAVVGLNVDAVDHFDTIIKSLVAIKKQVNPPPRVVDDLDVKIQCLNKLAQLLNQDDADILYAVIEDLEAA
jgi:hypothetical protein